MTFFNYKLNIWGKVMILTFILMETKMPLQPHLHFSRILNFFNFCEATLMYKTTTNVHR